MEVLLLGLLGLPGGHGQIAARRSLSSPRKHPRMVQDQLLDSFLRRRCAGSGCAVYIYQYKYTVYVYIYTHAFMHVDRTNMYIYIYICNYIYMKEIIANKILL